MAEIFEFRGVDKFYFAEIQKDTAEEYLCGTPIHIPVQEIGKTTDTSAEAHYYDNGPMIVVNSESADTITLTLAPPELATLAKMIGKSYDDELGMLVDSRRLNKYYAIMYRTKGTDGGYRYVSRLKGTFNIPEETVHTEDDGTDTANTQFTFTGINTVHEFNKGVYEDSQWKKSNAKGIVVDARYGLADVSSFFDSIQTPDTISGNNYVPVEGINVTPSSASLSVNGTEQLAAEITPATATNPNVNWYSSDRTVATVSNAGLVTAVGAGSADITATSVDGGFSGTCSVTVSE